MRQSRPPRPAAPSWRYPIAVYAASRVVAGAMAWMATRDQLAMPDPRYPDYHSAVPTPEAPDYWTLTTNWDGQWYRSIVEDGYPEVLPRDEHGAVDRSTWAFYPAYPMVVRALVRLTGGGFEIIAPLTSTVFGAIAMVLLYRLMVRHAEPFVARAAVAGLCFAMASPVFQFAYPESLAFALVLTCLCLVQARRWWWVAPAAIGLALTRPLAAPLGLALLCAAWVPWPGAARPDSGTKRSLTFAGLGIGALTLLWPAVAAWRTGRWDAYFATSKAWTSDLGSLVPGPGYLWRLGGALGLGLFMTAVGVVAFLSLRPAAASWGPLLRAWALAYPVFLLTMTVPGPSHIRYALLTGVWFSPFAAALPPDAIGARRVRVVTLCVVIGVGAALQFAWLDGFWRVVGWTP